MPVGEVWMGVRVRHDIQQADGDLAVGHRAEDAAILGTDADRSLPLLRELDAVE